MALAQLEHTCGSTMTEAENEDLFSGFIDGVLTQGDEQRVRVRLDRCSSCRRLVDELRTIRENARTTRFKEPAHRLEEQPTGPISSVLRLAGWILLIGWFIGNLVWLFAIDSLPSMTGKLLFALSLAGWTALLVSVLIDQLHRRKSDRYRRVVR